MRPADTSPEAWEVLLDPMRQMPPSEKLRCTFEYSAFVQSLAEGNLRRSYPHANEREIFLRSARQRLGADLFQGHTATNSQMREPLEQALSQLTPALDALGIRYAVVGSLASSAQGLYRATADGDLLVALAPGQAARLVAALGSDWYGVRPDRGRRAGWAW